MGTRRDIAEEQELLDRAYRGVEAMRADANGMLTEVLDLGKGGTFQSRTERDIVVRTSLARLAHLDIGDQALCFGRIDRAGEGSEVEVFHVGRVAVSGEDREPLVVDWRAPVAAPFYRATGLDPQGLVRRRHLAVKGRTVTGVEDEYFVDVPAATDAIGDANGDGDGVESASTSGEFRSSGTALVADASTLGGPGALLAALGQVRTGRMGDIVGTIQREQDEIIRAPQRGLLLVQGGPGTGKTAVALHRAAYLLYTHRFPLERQGVLVIGPNPLFLRYIEEVLPSLGETGVTLSTVAGLVPEVKVRGVDVPAVDRLKGDLRMVRVLAQALRTRERALRDDVSIPFGGSTLRLTRAKTKEITDRTRRRPGTHNARRRQVEASVIDSLFDQYRRWFGQITGDDEHSFDDEDVRGRLRALPEVKVALDRMWPRLSPHEFIHDLLGARALLAAASDGILSTAERDSLFRTRSEAFDDVHWTIGDAALVDEARPLLGPRHPRRARRLSGRAARVDRQARQYAFDEGAAAEGGFWPTNLDQEPAMIGHLSAEAVDPDGVRSYGHIVVDEVQDLSPLQLRMVARRSISGSMTVVGDIAQATGPWAPNDWEQVVSLLSADRTCHRVELTVSYRTPAEVITVARRLLPEAAVGVSSPVPVRRAGVEPVFSLVASSDVARSSAEAAIALSRDVGEGRVAVLVPGMLEADVLRHLAELGSPGTDPRDPDGQGLSSPIVVLPPTATNGLEFDAVVVVEPSLIAAGEAASAGIEGPIRPSIRGIRSLYVALTRTTRKLSVIGSVPDPAALWQD